METRRLGNTDLDITRLGFGAWAVGGGDWQYGWGHSEDDASIAAIRAALEMGVNWIDTAPVYGVGHSEEVVARALRGLAEKPYVFTKCGLIASRGHGVRNILEPDSIRREVEDSLRRLELDVIDLYQIHWPDPDEAIEDAWATLVELKAQGKVRHIGVSNFDVSQLRRVQPIGPVSSLQPPYSLIRPEIEAEILPYCREQGIGVIVYSPMQSGLLTGAMTRERIAAMPEDDWRRGDEQFTEPKLSQNLALVERLRTVAERHGRQVGEVAIAWTLRHPAVTGAIVGARRPDQVAGVFGAADLELSDDDLAVIASEEARV